MLNGRLVRLERTTLAISEENGKRQAVSIARGAILKVGSGPCGGDGLIDVVWDGRVFEMFEEDLEARSTALEGENLARK